MSQIKATAVNKIEGHMTSDDGEHMLLKTDLPTVLAFHESTLYPLLGSIIGAMGEVSKAKSGQHSARPAFDVEWWEIGLTPDKESLVLSYRLPGGAVLSFRVHPDQAAHMRDVLASLSGGAPTGPTSGSPLQ